MPGSPPPQALLRALFDAAVAQAQPARRIGAFLPTPPKGRTVVVGMGKASGAMAAAVDALWPREKPLSGVVVTRHGHVPPDTQAGRIDIVEAGHPVPDAAGLRAAHRIVQAVQGLGPDDLVLCLVSGGGSALLSLPLPGVSLHDKQAITQALLRSGARIDEINCVRKHLSAVKGGRLAAMCAPAKVVSLLISDVPGDAPEVIASGPTVADASTCADALDVLRRHRIAAPPLIEAGLREGRFESPKPGDARLARNEVHLIATPAQSLAAAADLARELGTEPRVLGDAIEGESREVGAAHARLALEMQGQLGPRPDPASPGSRHKDAEVTDLTAPSAPTGATSIASLRRPLVLLSGGETTVTVRHPQGRGGRATEFMLGCACALQGARGIHGLAADTDGIDGVQAHAGAWIGPHTLARAAAMGLDARWMLDRNDSGRFFEAIGDTVMTGPTFTNVNDFRALLIDRSEG